MENKYQTMSSKEVLDVFKNKINFPFMPNKLEQKFYVERCEELLKEIDNGKISKYYQIICENGSILDRFRFFLGKIENMKFSELIIDDIDFLVSFEICVCNIDNLIIKISMTDLTTNLFNIFMNLNELKNVVFEDLTRQSWKDIQYRRIPRSRYTFMRNLYLEFGKQCNCNCTFCRNQSFDNNKCQNKYDLEKIIANVKKFSYYIENIFVGGGEPSLKLDDIRKFMMYANFPRLGKELILVTNGSCSINDLRKTIGYSIHVYISRHAINDDENKKILNPSPGTEILSLSSLEKLSEEELNKITFTPVCIKGGLDSYEKIMDYILYAYYTVGINKILISSMQKDASLGKTEVDYEDCFVDPSIFDEVKKELIFRGFKEQIPIFSTGGYILNIFKYNMFTVTFKEYISMDKDEELWSTSIKKNFDFQMTPNGDIFEDWRCEKKLDLELL